MLGGYKLIYVPFFSIKLFDKLLSTISSKETFLRLNKLKPLFKSITLNNKNFT